MKTLQPGGQGLSPGWKGVASWVAYIQRNVYRLWKIHKQFRTKAFAEQSLSPCDEICWVGLAVGILRCPLALDLSWERHVTKGRENKLFRHWALGMSSWFDSAPSRSCRFIFNWFPLPLSPTYIFFFSESSPFVSLSVCALASSLVAEHPDL